MTLYVERKRFGFPPGGVRGPPSSSHNLIDGDRALRPAGARSEGQEAIAEASDAQDARIARFSETDSEEAARTSRG
jgi:hypothetical protein